MAMHGSAYATVSHVEHRLTGKTIKKGAIIFAPALIKVSKKVGTEPGDPQGADGPL